jgi:uncharacterized protein YigE (DUF2233 family)
MRLLLLPILLFAAACAEESRQAPGPAQQSACSSRLFEGSEFTVCSAAGPIEVRSSGPGGKPTRGFVDLESQLGERATDVAFAMNAGMFDEEGRAIGLLIEQGKEVHAINRRTGGGNFHLLPNGVFLVRRDGSAQVVTSARFKPSKDIASATQSGPMLLIDGKLHPDFEPDGESRNIRNGVGIGPDGRPLFVISEDFVSFGKFARFFRDSLKARNALYFDGSVSSLWDPAHGRRDIGAELGPMVVVFGQN